MNCPVYLLAKEGLNPRRDYALNHIQAHLGVAPIIIAGPDKLAPDFQSRVPADTNRSTITDGALACTMTHKAAWRAIQTSGDYALVLEDDIQFCGDVTLIQRCLDELERHAKGEWDWVQFREFNPECEEDDCVLYARGAPGDYPNITLSRRAHRLPWQTVCYGVSAKGAAALLGYTTPISIVNDYYTRFCHRDVAFYGPSVAGQNREFPSFIGYGEGAQ